MTRALVVVVGLFACACQSAYHQRCSSSDDCGDLTCARVGALSTPQPGRFCTGRCIASADCEQLFGEGSYCGISELCFHACEADTDCPADTECTADGFCAHSTEAP